MQQPVDSYVCNINTNSESILIMSYLLFVRYTSSYLILVHLYSAKSKSDEMRELSDLVLIP